ncbi:hypothetical protein MHT86_10045 [Corynebacterium mastitidis]|uniref:hypothetical protein n=2 Tax=Corynebacterium mastitidis TaxID=161890 RepID=UPI001F141386|nr:hypothetical protein [Corynebacterium mastitidis]MCH6197825.1 hypothetical protein [Corynebacterium mastitidis]
MKIMSYGSLRLAESNSGTGCDFRVTDEQWDIVTRSLRRYEEGVRLYFDQCLDGGLWIGDSYIMYGDQGPLDFTEGYTGIRRQVRFCQWQVASLSDRGEETLSVFRSSTFELSWKNVIGKLIWEKFFLSVLWHESRRSSFFSVWNMDRSHLFRIGRDDEFLEGFTEGAGAAYDRIMSHYSARDQGVDSSPFSGAGYIFLDRYDEDSWIESPMGNRSDLSWSFGLDVEEWVDLLFRVGSS